MPNICLAIIYWELECYFEFVKFIDNIIIYIFTGFGALHHAAAWGRLEVLKILAEFQSDLQQKNVHGERARETAVRYNHTECVDYLDWAGW